MCSRNVICVDLDGTLVKTDTLLELLILAVRKKPSTILRCFYWLLDGKANLKEKLTLIALRDLCAETLPYNLPLLEYLQEEKKKGRKIVLATASHVKVARKIADHLAVFDQVIGTDDRINLRGEKKAEGLLKALGNYDFTYVGNDKVDLHIWKKSVGAIVVGTPDRVKRKIECPIEAEFDVETNKISVLIRSLRVHQWTKNLLVFLPAVAAGIIADFEVLSQSLVGFGLLASTRVRLEERGISFQIINDLKNSTCEHIFNLPHIDVWYSLEDASCTLSSP